MKNLVKLFLITLTVAANASEIRDTKISKIMMDQQYGTELYIQVEGTPSRNAGHCHQNSTWDYAISTESEFGKQIFSQVLMAYAAQKNVKLTGNNTCNVCVSCEDLRRIEIY